EGCCASALFPEIEGSSSPLSRRINRPESLPTLYKGARGLFLGQCTNEFSKIVSWIVVAPGAVWTCARKNFFGAATRGASLGPPFHLNLIAPESTPSRSLSLMA